MDYYNENDPYAAQWLKNLEAAGLIPKGEVDERDIRKIRATELAGFRQAHFFAGIGGWAEALRLAGWPDDLEVWTGSCPCQPFSIASPNRKGLADERHLWPDFKRLIAERAPFAVFGEQVASKAGRSWLNGVSADLEALGYWVGSADLCAAGIGAPHIRQRLWWCAYRLSHSERPRREGKSSGRFRRLEERGIGLSAGDGFQYDPGILDAERLGLSGVLRWGAGSEPENGRANNDPWWPAEIRRWADGTTRRIEPGLAPLAHGVPARVGKLRAWGNAIVPALAAEFIGASMDALGIQPEKVRP